MKTKQRTVLSRDAEQATNYYTGQGYKILPYGIRKVPAGSVERLELIVKWRVLGGGYQHETHAILYK